MDERKVFRAELREACYELSALAAVVNSLAVRYAESGHECALSRVRRAARGVVDVAGELRPAEQIVTTWEREAQ